MNCTGEECKNIYSCQYLQARFKVLHCVDHTREVNRIHQLELKERESMLRREKAIWLK